MSKRKIEHLVIIDSIANENIVSDTLIELIDSFIVNNIQFLTVNIRKNSLINGVELSQGSYLVTLHNNVDSISLIDRISGVFPIHSRYMEKKYFFDITKKLDLGMKVVLKYAYHAGGPIDLSDIYLLYLQNDKLQELCHFAHWNYYYNDLDIKKSNDSLYSIKYIKRDKYGYFHNDYLVRINKHKIHVEYVTPDVQKTGYRTALLDKLTVYMTKDEAKNQKAVNTPIIIKPGEYIIIDSIYWRLKILKIDIIKGADGFVNMDEIGKSIDVDRAG
jgi:hypothetical protein